jgi:hypothetical protein
MTFDDRVRRGNTEPAQPVAFFSQEMIFGEHPRKDAL